MTIRRGSFSSYMYKHISQLAEDGFVVGVEVTSLSTFFRPGLNNSFTSSAASVSCVNIMTPTNSHR